MDLQKSVKYVNPMFFGYSVTPCVALSPPLPLLAHTRVTLRKFLSKDEHQSKEKVDGGISDRPGDPSITIEPGDLHAMRLN